MSQPPFRRSPATTSGFTLVEVVVALVVLGVGILAAARALTALERLDRAAGRRWAAAVLLESRVERMRAAPCAQRAGVDSARGVRARWNAVPDSGGILLADTARIARDGDVPLMVGVRSAAPC